MQELALTTLAMVADASEATIAEHYTAIMLMLLNMLRNASVAEHQKLRRRVMECVVLIGACSILHVHGD